MGQVLFSGWHHTFLRLRGESAKRFRLKSRGRTGVAAMEDLSLRTKAFVGLTALSGTAVLVYSLWHWQSADLTRFFCYLAVALLASVLKVQLPGIDGTMSVNLLFILMGVMELSLAETLVIGCAATLLQSIWHLGKRLDPVKVIFNVAGMMANASALTYVSYHWLAVRGGGNKPILLMVAALVFFFANTLPISLVIALTEGKSARKVWAECYFWSFPYYLVGAAAVGLVGGVNRQAGWATSLLVLPLIYWGYRSYRLYLGRLEAEKERVEVEKRHVEEIASLNMRTIEALALAIEAKDHTTHTHLQRVRTYAVEVAKELNLGPDQIEALRAAALLHDIGKLAVPEQIINKPGKLTPEEFEKMKVHPLVGAEILERVAFPYPVAPIVRSHHEAWDGSGYPDGLKGEEIPIGARILTVVDCFDALASDRPYRKAMSLQEAMVLLKSKAGVQFDPAIVELLEAHYEDLEKLACQRSSEMQPLKTDLLIERGAAPGAGFEAIPVNVGRRPDAAATTGPVTNAGHLSPGEVDAAIRELIAAFQHLGRRNSSDIRDLCSILSLRLRALIAFDCFAVFHHRDDSAVLLFKNGPCATAFSDAPLAAGTSLSCWVIESGRPIVNGNPTVETSLFAHRPFTANSSAMSIPLVDAGGSIFGALTLYSRDRAAFFSQHMQILQAVQPEFTPALQRAVSAAAKSLIEPDELDAES